MTNLVKYIFIFSSLAVLIYNAQSAKILASVFSPAYSHQIAFRPLWKELAKRGHQITLLTTDPMKDPSLINVHEIDLSKSYEIMEKANASKILADRGSQKKSLKQLLDIYLAALSDTASWQFSQPEMQNLIHNQSEHFDLIFMEMMYPAHLAFVDRFKAPFIGITSMDAPPRIHNSAGNPTNPVLYPDYSLPFVGVLNFRQRVISVLFSIFNWWYGEYHIYPIEDENVKQYFGNIRPLNEIQNDMDMLFINVNPIFHLIRPLGPNTIPIGGGQHLSNIKPLPEELKKYLDDAEEGVIYFSLGSNVKSSLIDANLLFNISGALSELPYKVLWKFEDDKLINKPNNVKIMKWIPQQDVLNHPNIKLFITQCGQQSMEEAIANNIPMIGMPFFGDQMNNAQILENKGFGKKVDKTDLDKDTFKSVILEVISNPIYKENVKIAAELTNDVQTVGLQSAVWWTEYVIRHKGAKHLRNSEVDLPFYKYYLLDVLLVVFTTITLVIYLVMFIIKRLVKLLK